MTLLVGETDVRALLADPRAIASAVELVNEAIAEQGRGRVALRSRIQVDYPPGSATEASGRSLRLLPAIVPSLGAAAVRVYTTNKDAGPGAPAPAELILVFDYESMRLRAIVEDYSLHTLRTGAPSAVATRALARPDSTVVGVLGSSRHARGQLAAVASVLELQQVRVHGRDAERREAFAREAEAALGVPVTPVASAREAVAGADVVCVATNTSAPVLLGEWLEPGQHVNSVAPCELDAAAVLRARLFPCDADEVLLGTPSWTPFPELVAAGRLAREALEADLGRVLAGEAPGRESADDVTLFVSTGMATWDVAAGVWAEREARAAGLGTELWDAELGRSVEGLVTPWPARVGGRA